MRKNDASRNVLLTKNKIHPIVNEFIEEYRDQIKRNYPTFSEQKDVFYYRANGEERWIIIIPGNDKSEFLDMLKDHLEDQGIKYKNLYNSGKTHVGYLVKKIKIFFSFGNRGEISEGLLGAAIVARFLNPQKVITSKDIDSVLNKIRSDYSFGKKKIKHSYHPTKKDIIHFKIAVSTVPMFMLMNNRIPINHLYTPILSYINSKNKIELVKNICLSKSGIYKNKAANKIEVISDGLVEQKTKKIDISVNIKTKGGNNIDLKNLKSITLKTMGTNQLHQYGGDKIEGINKFFQNIFNMKIPKSIKKEYTKNRKSMSKMENLSFILNKLHGVIQGKLSEASPQKFIKDLTNGIKSGAITDSDDGGSVTMVKLDKKDFAELDFSIIHDKLVNHNISAKYTSTGDPTIRILVKEYNSSEEKPLISIRARQDGKRVRLLLETGSYLKKLITISQDK